MHSVDELARPAALAEAHGVRVVADEIHAPLVYAPTRFTPYLSLPVGASAFSLMSPVQGVQPRGPEVALALAGAEAAADLAPYAEEAAFGSCHLGASPTQRRW